MIEETDYSSLLIHTLRLPIESQRDNPCLGPNKGKFLDRNLYIPHTFTVVDRLPGGRVK
jgi:hypothetical protein